LQFVGDGSKTNVDGQQVGDSLQGDVRMLGDDFAKECFVFDEFSFGTGRVVGRVDASGVFEMKFDFSYIGSGDSPFFGCLFCFHAVRTVF
jgi:hypothetical protein